MREIFIDFCSPFRHNTSPNTRALKSMACTNVSSLFPTPFMAWITNLTSAFLSYPFLINYIRGLTKLQVSDRNAQNFGVQLELLVNGIDIGEEWCDNYLDEPTQELVKSKASEARRSREWAHIQSMIATLLHWDGAEGGPWLCGK